MNAYDAAAQAHETAGKLVAGDRRETHGDFQENFRAIAAVWNGYLHAKHPSTMVLTMQDVAWMMVTLKIARTMHGGFNPDDYVDAIGYATIAAGLAEARK